MWKAAFQSLINSADLSPQTLYPMQALMGLPLGFMKVGLERMRR